MKYFVFEHTTTKVVRYKVYCDDPQLAEIKASCGCLKHILTKECVEFVEENEPKVTVKCVDEGNN